MKTWRTPAVINSQKSHLSFSTILWRCALQVAYNKWVISQCSKWGGCVTRCLHQPCQIHQSYETSFEFTSTLCDGQDGLCVTMPTHIWHKNFVQLMQCSCGCVSYSSLPSAPTAFFILVSRFYFRTITPEKQHGLIQLEKLLFVVQERDC